LSGKRRQSVGEFVQVQLKLADTPLDGCNDFDRLGGAEIVAKALKLPLDLAGVWSKRLQPDDLERARHLMKVGLAVPE